MQASPVVHQDQSETTPRRQLTLVDSTCIIVGIIVAAAIYRSSPVVAAQAPGEFWLLGFWLLGGLLSLVGALCYVELATAFPHEGGDYIYLTRAFGRPTGFVFGWSQLWIVRPGSIGAMAYAFADYANRIWPQAEGNRAMLVTLAYASGAIAALTAVNLLGIREGKWTQNILTAVKILGLLAVISVGLSCVAPVDSQDAVSAASLDSTSEARSDSAVEPATMTTDSTAATSADSSPARPPQLSLGAFGFAMILVLFAYGGWNEMAFVSAEVQNPHRNILRALLLGTVAVMVVYLLVNMAFLHALGLRGACHATAAADVLALAIGPWAGRTISLLICISALGAINGQIITGARIYYAMGNDHRLYGWLGRWDARRGQPIRSLWIQGAITLALVIGFGLYPNGFERMVIFTTPAFWFFLMLVSVSVFVLRYREPNVERPFRVPGYPLTPVLFGLSCAFMVYSSVSYAIEKSSWEAIWSIAFLFLGVAMSLCDPAARRS